jgi:hypothetical protein
MTRFMSAKEALTLTWDSPKEWHKTVMANTKKYRWLFNRILVLLVVRMPIRSARIFSSKKRSQYFSNFVILIAVTPQRVVFCQFTLT